MTLLALVVASALLWTPGAVLARLAGARAGWAAVTGPALTWGLAGSGAVAVPAVGLRWGPTSAALWWAVVALGLGALRLAVRRWGPVPPVPAGPLRRRALAGVVVAVVAAGSFLGVLGWRSGADPRRPDQLWDAVWHANLTTWIASTGRSDPRDAASALVGAGWRDAAAYYPDALHALAALVVHASGAPPVLALTAVVLVSLAGVVPVGVAALVWRLTSGSAVGAGAAALLSVLPLAFPTDQWWRGTWAFGVGLAAVPLACAVVVTACGSTAAWGAAHRSSPGAGGRVLAVVPAVLALGGLAALQPAAAVAACVVLAGWAVGEAAGRSWRLDLALAAGAVLAAVLLARAVAAVVPLSPTLSSLAEHDYATRRSAWTSLRQVLGLVTPVTPRLGYDVPLQPPQVLLAAVLVVAALVVLTQRRTAWLAAVWALFVAAAVATVQRGDSWLHPLTLFFYSSPFRLVAVVALLGAVVAGVALARLVRGAGRWRTTTAVAVVVALVAVAGAGTLQRGEDRLRVGYGDRVVGPDQEAVMRALAAQPLPAGARVLNDSYDGSPWLYALTGRMPMFTHYNAGTVPADLQRLREGLDRVDDDPEVRRLLVQYRVCLVYTNASTVTDSRRRSAGFTGLGGARSLELVAQRGGAAAYRVSDVVGSCR